MRSASAPGTVDGPGAGPESARGIELALFQRGLAARDVPSVAAGSAALALHTPAYMLHDFLTSNRPELVGRIRAKMGARSAPPARDEDLKSGVGVFLGQLVERLRSPGADGGAIGRSAAQNGDDLQRMGFSVGLVVHTYGDVCQAVTELAHDTDTAITTGELQTLSQCLDDAIAHAVTAHARRGERGGAAEGPARSGVLTHQLRNRLSAAMMSFSILEKSNAVVGGSTGAVLGRALRGMRDLLRDAPAGCEPGEVAHARSRVSVFALIEEMAVEAALEASTRGVGLAVTSSVAGVDVEANPLTLLAALSDLLRNAFAWSRPGGQVSLRTSATAARVLIEVEDECGGLPPGKLAALSRACAQQSADPRGRGLGLAVGRRSIAADGGELRVRDLPGRGCVFTIDLPRQPPP